MNAKFVSEMQNGRFLIDIDPELFCLLTGLDLARGLQPYSIMKIVAAVRQAKDNADIVESMEKTSDLLAKRKAKPKPRTIAELIDSLEPEQRKQIERYNAHEFDMYLLENGFDALRTGQRRAA